MHKTKEHFKFLRVLAALAILAAVVTPMLSKPAEAAGAFTQAFVRLDRIKAATATGGEVCAKPATTATEASVKVTFPTTGGTDYLVGGTAANWTVTTTNLDGTIWPGIGTATNVTGKTVTFPSSDLTVGTLYCFRFAAQLTTSSAGAAETTQGTVTTYDSVPAAIDTSTYAESIITNDQIVVSAVVPPSFSFVLSGNTDSFTSNLSTTAVTSTTGRTVTIITNAPTGWIIWAQDANNNGSGKGSLKSTIAGNYYIPGSTTPPAASHTLTNGTEDYGLGATINTDAAGGGTVSLNTNYDGTGSKAGSLDPLNMQAVASASGTANGDIVNINERATVAGQTPAATDYTDTITLTGAGRF